MQNIPEKKFNKKIIVKYYFIFNANTYLIFRLEAAHFTIYAGFRRLIYMIFTIFKFFFTLTLIIIFINLFILFNLCFIFIKIIKKHKV